MAIPVLIADAEVIYAAGVIHVLRQDSEMAVAPAMHTLADTERALALAEGGVAVIARSLIPDLSSLLRLASQSGVAVILLLAEQEHPDAAELACVKGALRRGDPPREFVRCVRTVAAGERCILPRTPDLPPRISAGERVLQQLSPRQLQVVQETAAGSKNAEIARRIGTSEQVVKNMLREIYDITGVSDRLELALFVLHHPELSKSPALNRKPGPKD